MSVVVCVFIENQNIEYRMNAQLWGWRTKVLSVKLDACTGKIVDFQSKGTSPGLLLQYLFLTHIIKGFHFGN